MVRTAMSEKLWTPSRERIDAAQITTFRAAAEAASGLNLPDYAALHAWSIDDPAAFWRLVWTDSGVIGDGPGESILRDGDRMPGAEFFPGARLNFAENLLRRADDRDAIVFWGEDQDRRRLTWAELDAKVAALAGALRADGVGVGDRVAGYLPNMPETIVAMLATASIGAVWSSCSPDFGVNWC